MELSDSIAIIAAAIAVSALFWQMHQSNKQSRMQTFLTYTQRYQDVMGSLPAGIESKAFKPSNDVLVNEENLKWLRAYFDLCSEEHYLYTEKLINKSVWALWRGGMKDALRNPAFLWAWEELQEDAYYHGEFADLINGLVAEIDNSETTTNT